MAKTTTQPMEISLSNIRIYSIQQYIKEQLTLLEYFSQRCPKDCTKKALQRVDLLHIELEFRALNYQTPFYADCILKSPKNLHKIYFLVDNSCNFEVISKSNILKQIDKKEK